MKSIKCEDKESIRLSKEFEGSDDFTSAEVIRYFNQKAKDYCKGDICEKGSCKGYWKDMNNEPGSSKNKREYSAEIYCKCE